MRIINLINFISLGIVVLTSDEVSFTLKSEFSNASNSHISNLHKRSRHAEQPIFVIEDSQDYCPQVFYPSRMWIVIECHRLSTNIITTALCGRVDNCWQSAFEKAKKVVEKLSIPEKVNLTTGTGWGSGPCVGNTGSVPRLGIPNLCLQDGPNGVRFTDFVTHFPSGLATACTFNKGLSYLRGKAIGRVLEQIHIYKE